VVLWESEQSCKIKIFQNEIQIFSGKLQGVVKFKVSKKSNQIQMLLGETESSSHIQIF
jgi:hypothetical protein